MVSTNGDYWATIMQFTGKADWWDWHFWFAPDNWSSLYVRFEFRSDYIVEYEGVYLDAIEVTGNYTPTPTTDLKPYLALGQDNKMVVSNVSGTGITTELAANEVTYVDWHIINNGTVSTEDNFSMRLYFDGNYLREWLVPPLDPNEIYGIFDYSFTNSVPGFHTLRMEIDPYLEIPDANLSNNIYERNLYWNTPQLTFTGQLLYWDMISPARTKPMRNVKIELWDDDWPEIIDQPDLLDTDTTDEYGHFTLGPVTNIEDDYQQDPFFKIYAENTISSVNISYNGPRWMYVTSYIDEIPSGTYDTIIAAPPDVSEAFNVVDAMADGKNAWLSFRPYDIPPNIQVVLKSDTERSSYNGVYLFINNDIADSLASPDSFDDDVILHEYGHHIENAFGFFDSSSGGPHSWLLRYDSKKAASEGFATFLSCLFRNSPVLRNYYWPYNEYAWVNCENGEGVSSAGSLGTANNQGATNEGAVAGILWDIFDNINDDYSSFDSTDLTDFSIPDGIGDTLSLGADEILECLVDREYAGRPVKDIHELFRVWFTGTPSFGHSRGMRSIWYEHGIDKCCIGFRGNADSDNNETCNVLDVNYLIMYMFGNGPRPLCIDEADVNGSGSFNVGDINYLNIYFFGGGPPPVECPLLAK